MCHVNIIPLNPTEGYKGGPSMADAVEQFVGVLARHGVVATPRCVFLSICGRFHADNVGF